jgi:hypothetical protein
MNCPFCCTPIWGEGWDSKTGEKFYSHVYDEYNDDSVCCWELSKKTYGNHERWKKKHLDKTVS